MKGAKLSNLARKQTSKTPSMPDWAASTSTSRQHRLWRALNCRKIHDKRRATTGTSISIQIQQILTFLATKASFKRKKIRTYYSKLRSSFDLKRYNNKVDIRKERWKVNCFYPGKILPKACQVTNTRSQNWLKTKKGKKSLRTTRVTGQDMLFNNTKINRNKVLF